MKKKGGKVKATCTVKLVSARHARLHWRLLRGGTAYAHGVVVAHNGVARVKLPSGLRRGRYALRIEGREQVTTVVVR